MHRYRGIAQHRLRPGGCHRKVPAVGQRVADVPERAFNVVVLDFEVADGRLVVGTPVDQVAAAVDQALFVEAHEGFAHGARELLVEREVFARPVHRGAEPSQLFVDVVADLVLPLPEALFEALATKVVARQPFLGQFTLNHVLGGDGGVIGARHPQRGPAVHALPANHQVLVGDEEDVAVVQLAGDVGRWDGDGEGPTFGVVGWLEGAGLVPGVVEPGFDRGRIVGAGHGVENGRGRLGLHRGVGYDGAAGRGRTLIVPLTATSDLRRSVGVKGGTVSRQPVPRGDGLARDGLGGFLAGSQASDAWDDRAEGGAGGGVGGPGGARGAGWRVPLAWDRGPAEGPGEGAGAPGVLEGC